MKNSNSDPNEGTADNCGGVRPDDIELGTDTAGVTHIYRTFVCDDVAGREWVAQSYLADGEYPFAELVNNVSIGVSA